MSAHAFAAGHAPTCADAAAHLGTFKFLSVGRTHPGKVRSVNEDALLERPDVGLWAVADGMGGHAAGDAASRMVVEALARVASFSSAYAFRNGVCTALQSVNARLTDAAAGGGASGSTVVALLVHMGHYACVWAGDSRAYLCRAGVLKRITRDHSYVQGLVDGGQLREEEARGHPSAHVITRAIGAAATLELDFAHGRIVSGDRFVLCSDGLTGMVRDFEIAQFLTRPPLEAGLEKMVSCALARGAPDNITALLVGAETKRLA